MLLLALVFLEPRAAVAVLEGSSDEVELVFGGWSGQGGSGGEQGKDGKDVRQFHCEVKSCSACVYV